MERIEYLVSKFLTSQITVEEKAELWEWKSKNEESFQQLITSWEDSSVPDIFKENQVWEKFLSKKEKVDLQDLQPSLYSEGGHHSGTSSLKLLKYAAVVFLFFTTSFTIWYFYVNQLQTIEISEITFMEKSAERGKRVSFTLPDGSKVTLNSGSQINFPEKFTNGKREIYLEGEAYFDVKRYENIPFIIYVNKAKITVLGTAFNLKAYSKRPDLQVAVEHGRVKVENLSGLKDTLILTNNEMAEITASHAGMSKRIFDHEEIFGWKNGTIIFRNASWTEITEKLENWFGVKIIAQKEIILKQGYNAEFRKESLKNVMESLSFSLDFRFQINEKEAEVIIFK